MANINWQQFSNQQPKPYVDPATAAAQAQAAKQAMWLKLHGPGAGRFPGYQSEPAPAAQSPAPFPGAGGLIPTAPQMQQPSGSAAFMGGNGILAPDLSQPSPVSLPQNNSQGPFGSPIDGGILGGGTSIQQPGTPAQAAPGPAAPRPDRLGTDEALRQNYIMGQDHRESPLVAGPMPTIPDPATGDIKAPAMSLPRSDFWKDENTGDGTTKYLGGAVSYDPSQDKFQDNRMGIIGSTLKDVGAYLDGKPQYATNIKGAISDQQDAADTAKSKDLLAQTRSDLVAANGDPAKVRAAILKYSLSGGDGEKLYKSITMGNPTLKGYPADQNIVSTDPLAGTDTIVHRAAPKLPPGYDADPNGGLRYITGGPADPRVAAALAGSKRAPKAAAPGAFVPRANPFITH